MGRVRRSAFWASVLAVLTAITAPAAFALATQAEVQVQTQVQEASPARIYTFSHEDIPVQLLKSAMQVCPEEATFTLTFAGDCTLGGEKGKDKAASSLGGLTQKYGPAYPFAGLLPLFAQDDLTVINLEGVLSDRDLAKTPDKLFNFIGKTAYTDSLIAGSVECVNLANNHIQDFGPEGYQDTVEALEKAGVAYFGESTVTVVEKDGVRIGLTGNVFLLSDDKKELLLKQWEALRAVGCQWIVHTMHAGVEYGTPSPKQRAVAAFAAANGVSLVVGHHPHVVQGMDIVDGVPVLYSLGNGAFGGNARPKDYDACLLRVQVIFKQGEPQAMQLSLFPIRISGENRYNNYQPILLSGTEAQRVIEKMQQTSAIELAPCQEGIGAVQPMIQYN